MTILDLRKTAIIPDHNRMAKNSFSSFKVAKATLLSEKRVFSSPELHSNDCVILRKSSRKSIQIKTKETGK